MCFPPFYKRQVAVEARERSRERIDALDQAMSVGGGVGTLHGDALPTVEMVS